MIRSKKTMILLGLTVVMSLLMCGSALAFTTPEEGAMFYEVYDLVINSILAGPIGFVLGAIFVIGGLFLLVQGKGFLLPLICLVGGVLLVKVQSIVTSFGFSMDSALSNALSTVKSIGQFLM